jgi:hypothetical protein
MMQRRSLGAHLRAGLITSVCLVATCAAFPMPGPATEKALTDEAGQAELRQWIGLLHNVGIELTTDELGAWVMWVARGSRKIRATVIAPFNQFFRLTATQQGWGLFAYPDTHPHTLMVQGAASAGPYRDLYVSQDPEHRWLAGTLHYRRIRALYNPGRRPPRTYGPFVTWLAARAFEDHADVDRVQVHFTRARTTLPWEPDTPEPSRMLHRKVRHRADLDAP